MVNNHTVQLHQYLVLESKVAKDMKCDRASMTHSVNAAAEIRIEEWRTHASRAASVDAEIDMLAEVLHAVVHVGAGVSFFTPFSIEEARAFWVDKFLPQVRAGTRRVLVARLDERRETIVGSVQLDLEMPPNQQHRAAVAKLLVHPAARPPPRNWKSIDDGPRRDCPI